MPSGRLFLITELAGNTPAGADDGERFEWTAADTAVGSKGGARACPKGSWPIGIKQHHVRTDYPNARTPSEQVLGPRRKPFTLTGRWMDKWNFPGYAEAEMARFEGLISRGKRCRFQYGAQVLEGLIEDFDADYKLPWDIGYSFTVSVHNRPDEQNFTRSPKTTLDANKAYDDLDLAVTAMLDVQNRAPRTYMTGTLATDTDQTLTGITEDRAALASTIDNRINNPSDKPTDAFRRTATQFRAVRASSYSVLLQLADVRADTALSVNSPIAVLAFDDWSRSLRYNARVAMARAQAGDAAMTERASPKAVRLYRPRKGESLYSIARKFYGTPFAWGLIYERNALRTFALLGTETLIIPDRGGS